MIISISIKVPSRGEKRSQMQLGRSVPSKVLSEYLLCAEEGARHCAMSTVSVLKEFGDTKFSHFTKPPMQSWLITF